MGKVIYLDHASTTPVDPEVVAAMLPWYSEEFGNPSTVYSLGVTAADAVQKARESVAQTIGAEPEEIYFTSGGTESDNWAILGTADAQQKKGRHLVTSTIEHHAVLETMEYLEKRGFELTKVPADSGGLVDPEDVRKAIRPDTILVSVMHANNEVGTIEPIAEIGKITREAGVLLHVDAVQTAGKLPLDVNELGVDMLSMSAHKFYGPKGVGLMYLRNRTRISPHLHGGGQERSRRAGTHNVPGVVGMAKALELATARMADDALREAGLRDKLWASLQGSIDAIYLNGDMTHRLPGNLNVRLDGIEGESMILMLDMEGICVSSGSACTTGSLDPSHVLLALGIPAEHAHGSLRVTLGRGTAAEDIDHFIKVFPPIVARLREMSPIWCANCVCKQRN
ncbi:MAG: cysteine desulfurase NifS [Thermoleophilia bacterium]|nr:cysteine desulfurase NifS [Thermoleophilia bacterium]